MDNKKSKKIWDKRSIAWEDAQIFLAVAENQSFSAAAKALGIGQPTISRRIQNLEQQLKQQLFIRGKQGAQATAEALRLVPAAEQMAKWAMEFDRATKGAEDAVSGTVTIAAPPGIAVAQLAPFAAQLKTQEPNIRLEVLSAVDQVDLTRGGVDIAIRASPANEPELVVLYEAEVQPMVMASKKYLKRIKQPCAWADLDWVTWAGQYRDVSPRPMLEKLIPNFEPIFASDDYLVQKAAVVAGVGAAVFSQPMAFEKSALLEVDVGVKLPVSRFYVISAKSMQQVPRVQAVVRALIKAMDIDA